MACARRTGQIIYGAVKGVVAYPLIFRFLYSPISEFLGISIFLQDSTRASFLSLSETVSPICLRFLNDMMTKFGSSKRTKLAGVGGPEIIHGVTSLGISDGLGRWCQGWGQLSPNRWLSEYIKDWRPRNKQNVQFLSRKILELIIVFWFLLCTHADSVEAVSLYKTLKPATSDKMHQLNRRSTSTAPWVPIVATLGGLIVLAIVITWWKRKKRIASSLWSRQSTRTAQSDGGVRVPLTADELAGTINNSSPAPAPRSRRTRRQRRTPSQQSTHSLPAYAKEPGEQELVVAQGLPEEDENISQPLAIVVNADEDIESSTETDSQTPSIPLQNAPAQIVLLVEGDTACDLSVRSGATGRNLRPASPDVDSTSSASIFQVDSHTSHNSPDPRGEAPGYFVMGQATVNRAFTAPESPDTSAALVTVDSGSRPASPLLSSSRRSGFRALLGRTAASRSHRAYPGSSGSGISLTIASPESPSHMHNRGASTTSLVSILGLSRQRSSASHNSSRPNLVSPSMISLNSISAPLTHTAVRTEFAAYPRQGLTPEQLQLISSREGLAKFGRPYGPDAVAFTSLSVIDLVTGQKPPDFEAAVGETRGSGVPSAGATGEPSEGTADEPQPIPESVVRPDQEHFPADLSQSRSPDISSTEQDTNATPAGTENTAIHDVPDEEKSAKILVAVHKGKAKEIPAQENNDSPEENKDHCYIKHFVPEASSETKQVPTSEIRSDLEAMFSSIEASTAPDIALLLPSFSARQTSATDFSNSSSSIQSASFNTTSRTNSLQLVDHGQPKSGQSARSSLMPARSESHASLLSNTSITSRGTFQTATESMRSRKMTKWMGTTDDEHEDDLGEFSYDTADDGNTTEGDDDSRPSTPVPSQQNRELGGGSELAGVASSTQLTPLAKKQVSIVTITHG